MIKVFNSPFRITQNYGVNKDYYSKFGLQGHEGLDIVPTTSDYTVFSLPFKGQVVKDIDMADKGGAYGITCTIWYPDISEAWQYCHLSSNRVFEGQEVSPSTPIGTMGNTGNTTGPHLHLNRFKVDSRGYRLNRDNGFLGGIDPLPFLQQDGETQPETPVDDHKARGIQVLDEYRAQRVAGPEGNYESFVRAVIDSDRNIAGVRADLATAQNTITDTKKGCDLEKIALEKTLKDGFNSDKTELEKEWQKKVDSARTTALSDLSVGEVFGVLISKLFPKGVNG